MENYFRAFEKNIELENPSSCKEFYDLIKDCFYQASKTDQWFRNIDTSRIIDLIFNGSQNNRKVNDEFDFNMKLFTIFSNIYNDIVKEDQVFRNYTKSKNKNDLIKKVIENINNNINLLRNGAKIKEETDKIIKPLYGGDIKERLLTFKYNLILKKYQIISLKESDFNSTFKYLKSIYDNRESSFFKDVDEIFYNSILRALHVLTNKLIVTQKSLKELCNQLIEVNNNVIHKFTSPFDEDDPIGRLNNDINENSKYLEWLNSEMSAKNCKPIQIKEKNEKERIMQEKLKREEEEKKRKAAEEAERLRKEEEKRKAAEEAERLRKEEEERRKREEVLRKQKEEEERKRKEEERIRQEELKREEEKNRKAAEEAERLRKEQERSKKEEEEERIRQEILKKEEEKRKSSEKVIKDDYAPLENLTIGRAKLPQRTRRASIHVVSLRVKQKKEDERKKQIDFQKMLENQDSVSEEKEVNNSPKILKGSAKIPGFNINLIGELKGNNLFKRKSNN